MTFKEIQNWILNIFWISIIFLNDKNDTKFKNNDITMNAAKFTRHHRVMRVARDKCGSFMAEELVCMLQSNI